MRSHTAGLSHPAVLVRNSDMFGLPVTARACTLSNPLLVQEGATLDSATLINSHEEGGGDVGLSFTKKGLAVTLSIVC